MQIHFRTRPKTTGWARSAAISLLAGLGVAMLSLPLSFFLFLSHFESVYPKDTQNMLSSITSGVLVSIGLALLVFSSGMLIFLLLGLRKSRPHES